MQPNKTIFFSIIGAAILICFGMMAVSYFLADSLNLPSKPEDIEIQIVVASSIKNWATQAAREFNADNPKTQIRIIAADELVPLSDLQSNNPQIGPPAAWLAEASFVVDMAQKPGLQFEDLQSVASTAMAWGGFDNKLDALNLSGSNLSWQTINAAASGSNGLKLVISDPHDSAEGLAALISATAAFAGSETLSTSEISAADSWLNETFGQRNTRVPATPGGDFATKGVSAGDVGILSQASWFDVRLNEKAGFTLTPTQPQVVLDYPFAIRSDSSAQAKAAAVAFRDLLLEDVYQNALADESLDPAGANQGGVQIDGNAAQRLLDGTNRWLK